MAQSCRASSVVLPLIACAALNAGCDATAPTNPGSVAPVVSVSPVGGSQSAIQAPASETYYSANRAGFAATVDHDDEHQGPLPIGFTFDYYGTAYTELYVTTNGLVCFGSGPDDYSNTPLATSTVKNCIFAYWDDLMLYGSQSPEQMILYRTVGPAGARIFVVQWTNIGFYNSTVPMGTFAVVLYEGTNVVKLQYRQLLTSVPDANGRNSLGNSATIGINNADGSQNVQYSSDTDKALSQWQTITYTPDAGALGGYVQNSDAVYEPVLLGTCGTAPPALATLTSPDEGAVVSTQPTFQWDTVANATSYRVVISLQSSLNNPVQDQSGITVTSYTLPSTLSAGTTYYWAVVSSNACGATWSAARSFQTSTGQPPVADAQSVEVLENTDVTITLAGSDPSGLPITARISSLPAHGSLFQYEGTGRGAVIDAIGTSVTDPSWRVVYDPAGTGSGAGWGDFRFKVQNSLGVDSSEGTVSVTVLAVNRAPTGLTLTPASVVDHQDAGAIVGALEATDPDAGDTFTYSVETAGVPFAVSGNQLVTTAVLDYDGASSYDVTLRATDAGGLYFEDAYHVVVERALGTACAGATECGTGSCVDGVCCDSACGSDSNDCMACSVAAGAAADGLCGPSTGNACDDGNACTQVDTCDAGVCAGAAPVVCTASDQCHDPGTCDPGTGACSDPAKPDGVTCDDGDACSQSDTCLSGVCTGSDPVTCVPLDQCHLSGACQSSDASCTNPDAPDGTSCDAGTGECRGGLCKSVAGQTCGLDTDCVLGHCVDGVCCDSACTGQCEACNVPEHLGTCTPVTGAPVGERPACAGAGTTCGGSCDGNDRAACAYPDATVQCGAPSCTSGLATLASYCAGDGTCPVAQTQACGDYVCGATACLGDCVHDADCAASHWCSGGVCVPTEADGSSCAADPECTSGHCADGLCCNVACDGQCEACDVAGSEGACTPVAGAPHGARPACADDGSGCGGTCDGTLTTACAYPSSVVSCGAASCTDGVATLERFCRGDGTCDAAVNESCGLYRCGDAYCLGDCQADADCAGGSYCAAGVCQPLKAAGELCTGAGQCGSGFCVDGVCCSTACDGQCEACDVVGSEGACTPVAGVPHGSRPSCATDGGPCGGSCDGSHPAACQYPGADVQCRAAGCTAGVATLAATCNGAGSCPDLATQPCGSYACGPSACLGDCTSGVDCSPGSYCSGGVCAPWKASGAACAAGIECASGSCVDGVCCDGGCDGQCEACNVAGHEGTCAPVTGAPVGARPACASDGSACGGSCDGEVRSACAYPGAEITCRAPSCSDGIAAPAAVCGGDGSCAPRTALGCGRYGCTGDACATTCASDEDCYGPNVCRNGVCEKPAAPSGTGRSGGCSAIRPRGNGLLALVAALLLFTRRRRGRARLGL